MRHASSLRAAGGIVRAGVLSILIADCYEVFPAPAAVYLEDSWAVEVPPTAEGVSLRLEAVLAPAHPIGVGT